MQARVFLVDDDDAVRDALSRLFDGAGLPVTACADGPALLAACTGEQPGCIVLDLDLPGMNGLQIQAELRARSITLPVIFLSGKGSVASTASALKAGAFDFVEKPIEGRVLVALARDAILADAELRSRAARRGETESRLAQLTAREREVVELALHGLANKQIASRLGISYRTIEIHRSRVLRKMGVSNLLELDRMMNFGEPGAAAKSDEDTGSPGR